MGKTRQITLIEMIDVIVKRREKNVSTAKSCITFNYAGFFSLDKAPAGTNKGMYLCT